MNNDEGQIAIDFLLGISLVLIALSFTMQFIPGMFATGTTGESSLDYTAYRTAAILTEDAGWWENSTLNGTDWESHPDEMMRMGLAVDDETGTRLTNNPNLIAKSKIERFMQVNESTFTEILGLYNNVEGSHFVYGYNISIIQNEEPIFLNNTTIVRGTIAPENTEIAKITRLLLVENGTSAVFTGDELTGIYISKASINVTGPFDENISIQMRDLNISDSNPVFLNASLNGTLLVQPSDYTVHLLEGWDMSAHNGTLNSGEVLCLNFDYNIFSMNTTYRLDLEFNNVTFNSSGISATSYNDRSNTRYEPARLVVEVWR